MEGESGQDSSRYQAGLLRQIEALGAKQSSMQAKLQELKTSSDDAGGISRKGGIILGIK